MSSKNLIRQDTIEFRSAPIKLVGLLLLGIILTSLCALISFHKIGELPNYSYRFIVILFGVVFFGLVTLSIVWQLLNVYQVRLRLSPEGIWMRQWGDIVFLPWNSINEIAKLKSGRQEFLMVHVSAEKYGELRRGYVGTILQMLNKPYIGANIMLPTSGLEIPLYKLEVVVTAYFNSFVASKKAST